MSALTPMEALWLSGAADCFTSADLEILLAYGHAYDQRGGGVEIEVKEDKQGLSTPKRNKKRAPAQQMLTQLEVLAHNTLVWARLWLADQCPKLAAFGLKRLIREVLHLNGCALFDRHNHLRTLLLSKANPFAATLARGLEALLAPQHVAVYLGEI